MMQGKFVLVTGACDKIGSAVARRLAAEGASLILSSPNLRDLAQLNDEVTKLGGDAILVQADLVDLDQIAALASSIAGLAGKLDVLVSTHFYTSAPNLIVDYEVEEWQKILELNFSVNWYLIKHLDGLLKLSDSGKVVFTALESIFGKNPLYFSPYVATNAAMNALMEGYARDAINNSVKVNMVMIENYILNSNEEPCFELLDTYLRLCSSRCQIFGRKHFVSYNEGK